MKELELSWSFNDGNYKITKRYLAKAKKALTDKQNEML